MAYDEYLANRVRRVLTTRDAEVTERKMFGGISFMAGGTMCCGVLNRDLFVRVGPDQRQEALTQPGTRVFDFSGRPSSGMIYVAPEAIPTTAALEQWVDRGLAFVASQAPAFDRKGHKK
jgi:TfoX/Sxy family transcriptional regulator of competence genes